MWLNKALNPRFKLQNSEPRKRDLDNEILRMKFFNKTRLQQRQSGRWGSNTNNSKHIEEKYDEWL